MGTTKRMQDLYEHTYLSGGTNYLDQLYEQYLHDPESLPPAWRQYFEQLPYPKTITEDVSHQEIQDYFYKLAQTPKEQIAVSRDAIFERKQVKVEQLIRAYRRYGHLAAQLDPLGSERPHVHQLELEHHDLSKADFNTQFRAPDLTGTSYATLEHIYDHLNSIYCHHIGYEYMEIRNEDEVNWLRDKIEQDKKIAEISATHKKQILKELIAADCFERTLETKYVGQKRFSLEGADSLVPLLREMLEYASLHKMSETVLGMAHRGRINLMLNVLGLSAEELYLTFEGREDYGKTTGDVKYHLGFSSDIKTPYGPMHVALTFNPSHLEAINPVVMGSVRARQDKRGNHTVDQVLPVLIHGDASYSGQGVVMETLSMSQTKAYHIGGTVHVIVNNQIGFTTSERLDARSSIYCSDVARMIDAPVFHVNADDPEAVIKAARLAFEYRMTFHKDVVIDLVCYRRHGHNEADEPRATQPLMYKKIAEHPRPREIYAEQLISENVIEADEVDAMWRNYRQMLDEGKSVVQTIPGGLVHTRRADWSKFYNQEWNVAAQTAVDSKQARQIAQKLYKIPKEFSLQKQVKFIMESRAEMAEGKKPLDWGFGETLAYATLLLEGYPVRLSGQDSQRGTFGHRHAVLHDQKTGDQYMPLAHLERKQARFEIYNSLLSEAGAMGFEYGYATADPNVLVIWEAQFGDFANGAQVIIDQFISSGWQKWQRLSGLVLFLPHGYEGQGPEHSSARLERFMQLCAQKNIQVCVPTTPAQIFHLLRRQVLRPFRKPLIVMTPKSLLRHRLATSDWDALVHGKYELVIPEIDDIDPKNVKRVVLCCGKVYYDLLARRREKEQSDVAIVRIEQLYPFPYDALTAVLQDYHKTNDIIWCQEEPRNQGAWYPNRHRLRRCLQPGQTLNYAGRPPFAAPAVGYPGLHKKQQQQLVEDALQMNQRRQKGNDD